MDQFIQNITAQFCLYIITGQSIHNINKFTWNAKLSRKNLSNSLQLETRHHCDCSGSSLCRCQWVWKTQWWLQPGMYQHSWIIPLHLSCWLQTAPQVQYHVLGTPITVFDVFHLECQQTYITWRTPWSTVILKKLISHSSGQEIFHLQYSHLSLSLPRNLPTRFCMQLCFRTNLQVQDITTSESKVPC